MKPGVVLVWIVGENWIIKIWNPFLPKGGENIKQTTFSVMGQTDGNSYFFLRNMENKLNFTMKYD